VAPQQKLLVFSAPEQSAILDQILSHDGQIKSIAISPNGNYVAVGSDRQVSIYAVHDPHAAPQPVMLSTQTPQINSQRINFSPDSNKVVIATRETNGQIEIILYDRVKSQESWPRKTPKVSFVSPRPSASADSKASID